MLKKKLAKKKKKAGNPIGENYQIHVQPSRTKFSSTSYNNFKSLPYWFKKDYTKMLQKKIQMIWQIIKRIYWPIFFFFCTKKRLSVITHSLLIRRLKHSHIKIQRKMKMIMEIWYNRYLLITI